MNDKELHKLIKHLKKTKHGRAALSTSAFLREIKLERGEL